MYIVLSALKKLVTVRRIFKIRVYTLSGGMSEIQRFSLSLHQALDTGAVSQGGFLYTPPLPALPFSVG
jgi:hypothetical protein